MIPAEIICQEAETKADQDPYDDIDRKITE